ncbi:MAG: hypothetical protein GY775_16745 [Candidatus Scalindua sp.]|nr:hypothetical protein [Candidatus Scalindua sp.]
MKYKEWTKINWDGNISLGYKCYRKSFERGHVSIGIGTFKLIVYSHGANSDNSLCGTRWRSNEKTITEEEAMAIVDRNKGYHNYKDND